MKKKLLFVIPSLGAGGAEKSLVNLLNVINSDQYEVDLFLFSAEGLFMKQLPDSVKILPKSKMMETFQKPLGKSVMHFLFRGNWLLACNRLRFAQIQRSYKNKSLGEQYSWKRLAKAIQPLSKEYDAAIGFLEKSSVYFVIDKVKATKKIGFIHNDYRHLGLDAQYDTHYFGKLNDIATVSEECVHSLSSTFPNLRSKIRLVSNIVSTKLIRSLSKEFDPRVEAHAIFSVGRLHPQKGFDMAVEAARILKEKMIKFHWYLIGEGAERPYLEDLIKKYGLEDCFTLLGLRENPYPYIRQAEVFVQCSRYEGKSIAIDEAKILAKPILLTDFSTAKDQIENGVNGLIVGMNADAIAEGIMEYLHDHGFRNRVKARLAAENFGTESEIDKFYELI